MAEEQGWFDNFTDYILDFNFGDDKTGLAENIWGFFQNPEGETDWSKVIAAGGGIANLMGWLPDDFFGAQNTKVGYQGGIPKYTATRQRIPETYDAERRPGSGGQRYFTDINYTPEGGTSPDLSTQLETLKAANLANPVSYPDTTTDTTTGTTTGITTGTTTPAPTVPEAETYLTPEEKAKFGLLPPPEETTPLYGGGLARLAPKYKRGGLATSVKRLNTGGLPEMASRYLGTARDGMADNIPATIDGKDPARLSGGEFVVAADVVSGLGNGNSDAGAQQLYSMMDRIRQARTGTTQQGRQINPRNIMPV
jgi:hypothetical protein